MAEIYFKKWADTTADRLKLMVQQLGEPDSQPNEVMQLVLASVRPRPMRPRPMHIRTVVCRLPPGSASHTSQMLPPGLHPILASHLGAILIGRVVTRRSPTRCSIWHASLPKECRQGVPTPQLFRAPMGQHPHTQRAAKRKRRPRRSHSLRELPREVASSSCCLRRHLPNRNIGSEHVVRLLKHRLDATVDSCWLW